MTQQRNFYTFLMVILFFSNGIGPNAKVNVSMTSPGSYCREKWLHLFLHDDMFKKYGTLQDSSYSGFKMANENPDTIHGINVNIYLCSLDILRSIKK